jgi:hypothetical protein
LALCGGIDFTRDRWDHAAGAKRAAGDGRGHILCAVVRVGQAVYLPSRQVAFPGQRHFAPRYVLRPELDAEAPLAGHDDQIDLASATRDSEVDQQDSRDIAAHEFVAHHVDGPSLMSVCGLLAVENGYRAERLRSLRALTHGRHPIDLMVRRNLADWSQPVDDQPRFDEIRLRPGFIRRIRALTAEELDGYVLIDRPKPKLPRQPPLAWLTRLPRGVGLRTALTVPFLVQTRRGTLGADALLNIPVEAIDEPFGLIDLIAVNATHRDDPASTFASSPKENRKRQIREALKQLAAEDLQMVQLPVSGRGQPRFSDVHLNREDGAYGIDEPPRY